MTRPGRRDNDGANWKIACDGGDCDVEWAGTITLDAVKLHFDISHPEHEGPIAFRTVWVGPGAAPVIPTNRAARRREEQRERRRNR